jgi:hypothetical protein
VLACGAGVIAPVIAFALPRVVFNLVDEEIPPYVAVAEGEQRLIKNLRSTSPRRHHLKRFR